MKPEIDPAGYERQLEEKVERVQRLLAPLEPPAPDIHRSQPVHFRMRAEFRIWHANGHARYAMFDPGEPRRPILLDRFPAASRAINELMPAVIGAVNDDPALKERLFRVDFLSGLAGDTLVTLVYNRPLDDAWSAAAAHLHSSLNTSIVGRSRRRKVVLGRDYIVEELEINGRRYRYKQVESGFTQPNASVNAAMVGWAMDSAGRRDDDLLELYCGNGNFTIPLAGSFRSVLATEVAKTSVRAAGFNLEQNDVRNVTLVRMSSDEITQAFGGEREFFRLRHLDLAAGRFNTLFVDPPRSGLDPGTVHLAGRFDRIIYVSCNPQTLFENIVDLSGGYRLERFAVFDQFPYTPHIECAVLLERR